MAVSYSVHIEPPTMRRIFRIALPMVISQTTDTVMLFADRLFLSRLGKVYIAASMSGGQINFMIQTLFLGLIGYVNAIAAQYYGANKKEKCAGAVTQGLYVSLIAYPLVLLSIPLVYRFFSLAGHTDTQIALEFSYFRILILGAILSFVRTAINGFFIGTGKTRIVMAANLVAMLLNVPLNYIFIFGKFGFPAMGIRGAAFGTLGGSLGATIIMACFYFSRQY